ncbi:MAG TPA: type VI secretion system contractile sheath small subunit [Planctomycetota bacterium]|nr:type VI secretion system contractile sheath small subunit [Planctomycetota bacterium]
MQSFEFGFGTSRGKKREEEIMHVGVLADLSGQPAEPLPLVPHRKFLEIDVDNFDDRLGTLGPRLAFAVPNSVVGKGELNVEVKFRSLEDFEPQAVCSQVPVLRKLLAARRRLAAMRATPKGRELQGRPQLEALLAQAVEDPELRVAILPSLGAAPPAPEAPAAPTPEPAPQEKPQASALSDLEKLLGLKPGDRPAPKPKGVVQGIVEQALADTPRISAEAVQNLGALIGRMDELLAQQLTLTLRHRAFKTLEGTWRGLHYLVSNVEMDEDLKLRVFDMSKEDLAATALAYQGENWELHPLRTQMRHEPFGCLIGDYYFDHSPANVAVLAGVARLVQELDLPFIAAVTPKLLGLEDWRQLRVTADTGCALQDEAHAAWRLIGQSAAAKQLFLTMPRFLARLPYGKKTNPAEGIEYEEKHDITSSADFVWCNAAYGLGVVLARAFKADGWAASLRSGGEDCMVEGLPALHYTDQYGDTELMCPTEVSLTVEAAATLNHLGLTPLLHMKNTDRAIFAAAPALHRPAK